MKTTLLLLLAVLFCVGCAHASPRFEPEVQASVAGDMRRLETEALILYYPEGWQDEATRVGARLDRCVRALRTQTKVKNDWSDQKPRLVLPAIPYNNAYVQPASGIEPIGVIPTYSTADLFSILGIPPDPSVIGCHEVVHYIHTLQISGFAKFVTNVLGATYSPQIGIDPWFSEGLAVYFETRLQPGVGRLRSRYFEGVLAAGSAEEGIDTASPNARHREPLHGGPYLVGAAFVDWLVEHYGEEKLFEVVQEQASAFLFPMLVERRFKHVYDKSLTTLFYEFRKELQKKHPKTPRPPEQRVVLPNDEVGRDARYTRGASGHEAIISDGFDRPTRLVIRDPKGGTLLDRNLTDILPGRTFVAPSTSLASGLSFTKDGKKLYFVMVDRGTLYMRSRLVVVDVENRDLDIVADDLSGSGGSVAPDGSAYYFARASGDSWGIAAIDLTTKAIRWVRAPERERYHTAVRVSPDGTRLVALRGRQDGTSLAIVDIKSGALRDREQDGTILTPDWVDNDHVLFTAESRGRMQVHVAPLDGPSQVVSHAPYLAFTPQAHDGKIRFLNRHGWWWSLDEIPIAPQADPRPPAPPSVASFTAEAPPATATVIQSDEPYSSLERIWYPQVRSPWLSVRGSNGTSFGLGASGGDVLGRHRWAINAGYNIPGQLLSGSVEYINGQLAPVQVVAAAAHYASREQVIRDDKLVDRRDPLTQKAIDQRETIAVLAAGRTFYSGTTLVTGARFDSLDRGLEDHSASLDERRFAGYLASLSYVAAEGTLYTGARRAIAASVTGTMFPKLWADFPIGDGAASLTLRHHLFPRRLIAGLDLRGRYLAGVPDGVSLLQIGGTSSITPELRNAVDAPPAGRDIAGILPPGLRFLEPLAGFEDLARYDRGVASGEVTLRYPIITDWGSLSSLYIFPSFLLRQIDVVAFASGARFRDARDPSAAAGGRVLVRTALWLAPLTLQFQVAKRLTDDEKPAFSCTVLVE